MTTPEILATLFGAFGKADDTARIVIYTKALDGKMPPVLLEKAVHRAMYECKFLPSIAELISFAESLNAEANPAVKVKSWDEAWAEIESKMYATAWGKDPQWSTPEIAAAVASFGGLMALQMAPGAMLATNRAQIKKLYESVCSRVKDKAHNEFVLGRNPAGLLGIPADIVKQIAK